MAKKYLDDTGMSYFWGKLKAYFQEKLVSGTNIKTINSEPLLGSGDITLPIVAGAYRTSNETAVSLATTNKIIGCTNSYLAANDNFAYTSDGGIRILKNASLVVIVGTMYAEGLTSGDTFAAGVGSYASGWKHELTSAIDKTASTERAVTVVTTTNASANDIFYLRARNVTSARGSVTVARFAVFVL